MESIMNIMRLKVDDLEEKEKNRKKERKKEKKLKR